MKLLLSSFSVKIKTYIILIVVLGIYQNGFGQVPFPPSKSVVDTIYGIQLKDPFVIFEDTANLEGNRWIEKKNLEAIRSLRDQSVYTTLLDRISALSVSTPIRAGVPLNNDGIIYSRLRFTESNEVKLVKYNSIDRPYEVLLTSELFTFNGTPYELFDYNPSPDNRYIALQLYPKGLDDMIIRVYDTKKGAFTEDVIDKNVSYYPFWLPDSKSFFYTQLSGQDSFDSVRVKCHVIGESQELDQLVLDRNPSSTLPYQEGDFPSIQMLPDAEHVVCSMAYGISQYVDYYIAPLNEILNKQPISWQRITSPDQQILTADFSHQDAFLLRAEPDSSTSIVHFNIQQPDNVKVLKNEREGFIADMMVEEEVLYYEKSFQGTSTLLQINLINRSTSAIPLPFRGDLELNTESPIRMNGSGLFFGLSAWNQGYGIYYYQPARDTVVRTDIRPAGKHETPDDIIVEQVLVNSHDLTEVPLTIIYKKGVRIQNKAPVIVEAYGAYGESLEPYFQVEFLPWLENGGILAKAHIRGGGENGPQWHTAGRKGSKSNSWKDLIACAQFLVEKKYTIPERLGIIGASAGGIAVGMALNETPNLFGAAVLSYPVVIPTQVEDEAQFDEFGNPNDSIEFTHLYQMDPYFNISEKDYPPILVIAGATDARIPLESVAKYTARIQQVSKQPIFLRVYDTGHGTEGVENNQELAEMFSFFMTQLNVAYQ